MRFIVIETWENLPSPTVCTTEEGEGLYFGSVEEAQEYADENCQEGLVLPMSNDLMPLLKDAANYIDVLKFEAMEETDESNVESRIFELIKSDK